MGKRLYNAERGAIQLFKRRLRVYRNIFQSHVISSTEYKRNSLQINFGENIHLSLNCLDTTAQLVQLAVDARMDRFWLRFAAGSAEEGVYGGGEQFSYFNLRGKSFQMLTREQGVGRNASELGLLQIAEGNHFNSSTRLDTMQLLFT